MGAPLAWCDETALLHEPDPPASHRHRSKLELILGARYWRRGQAFSFFDIADHDTDNLIRLGFNVHQCTRAVIT
jgi:hypothetical protein